jgi:hypothetical protein
MLVLSSVSSSTHELEVDTVSIEVHASMGHPNVSCIQTARLQE